VFYVGYNVERHPSESFPAAKLQSFIELYQDPPWIHIEVEAFLHFFDYHLFLLLLVGHVFLNLGLNHFVFGPQSTKFEFDLPHLVEVALEDLNSVVFKELLDPC
jgi:hypothetical protein